MQFSGDNGKIYQEQNNDSLEGRQEIKTPHTPSSKLVLKPLFHTRQSVLIQLIAPSSITLIYSILHMIHPVNLFIACMSQTSLQFSTWQATLQITHMGDAFFLNNA